MFPAGRSTGRQGDDVPGAAPLKNGSATVPADSLTSVAEARDRTRQAISQRPRVEHDYVDALRRDPHMAPEPLTSPGIHASQRDTSHLVSIRLERSSQNMKRPPPCCVSAVRRGSTFMWRRQDSNLGRLSRQIYSGTDLAALTCNFIRFQPLWGTHGGMRLPVSRPNRRALANACPRRPTPDELSGPSPAVSPRRTQPPGQRACQSPADIDEPPCIMRLRSLEGRPRHPSKGVSHSEVDSQ
jgi:hypothetical protein